MKRDTMTDNAESPDAGEELVDDSRDIVIDASSETELTETPSQGVSELRETMAQQDSEAEKYAIEFLKKVIRIRGVEAIGQRGDPRRNRPGDPSGGSTGYQGDDQGCLR